METDNDFESIELNDKSPDVVSTVDLTQVTGYLVWLEYSYGDSFGYHRGGSTEAVAVVSTKEQAEELKEYLLNWTSTDKNTLNENYSLKYTTGDGQEIAYVVVPWSDYFNTLGEVHIEEVSL